MLKSEIKLQNGLPRLFVEGKETPAMAYTTYFNERSENEDFARAGYRIFFVNISMTKAPINSTYTGFSPFRVGVFEDAEHPDYSEFEDEVHKILAFCPDAIIFVRINLSMPAWWVESHPDEVTQTSKGGKREAMCSPVFHRDGNRLLTELVEHVKASDYASRVGGWQLCGGHTQEWFHHDLHGSISKAAEEPYRVWAKENYGIENAVLPSVEDYKDDGTGINKNENAVRYALFCNEVVAKTVDRFAKTVKELTDNTQVVGAFYGYLYEVQTPLLGSYGLRFLLDSPYLDFFSSPNAYFRDRALGIDWADMLPVDSLKLHGKLCFVECDIRTYLTGSIQEARPGEYPDGIYTLAYAKDPSVPTVWAGPPTAELSREALRKCFSHQIVKGSAIWWFDMWGGWYHDPFLMDELAEMMEYSKRDLVVGNACSAAEVVFFADETGYANHLENSALQWSVLRMRSGVMGNAGAPYDSFMVEDAEAVLDRYKAVVFPYALPSESAKRVMALCEKKGIPYLRITPEKLAFTLEEVREFYRKSGVHLYLETNDVVWMGNGYLGVHAATEGTKTVKLPSVMRVKPLFGSAQEETLTDTVTVELATFGTALFAVSPVADK
ncbi:MAG: hypothetical protein J6S44_02615 [Clostridia bacterium]|nr:hypothetical protein [Clostridia bacterium]